MAGGNVFVTMAAAVAAGLALGGSSYTIVIDPTSGAPIVPAAAGALDLTNANLVGQAGSPTTTLTFQTGATIASGKFPTSVRDLTLASTSTAAVHSLANGEFATIGPNVTVTGSSSAPFFTGTGGIAAAVEMIGPNTTLGNGSNAVINSTSPTILSLAVDFACSVNASALAGTGTINANVDAGGSINNTQSVTTLNLTFENTLNFLSASSFTLGPNTTIGAGTGSITAQRNGIFLVYASISFTDTIANERVEIALLRDGGTFLFTQFMTSNATAGKDNQCTMVILDAAPDRLGHTYAVAALGGGQLTTTTSLVIVQAIEIF